MFRIKPALMAGIATLAVSGGVALAQMSGAYDPAQLPEMKGKVQQYSLTPRGDVDGLILADGTEVHFPPNNSTELVFVVRPGDAVTIHGLKARAAPMVAAMSITNDASGATVTAGGRRPRGPESLIEASGTVKATLHGVAGEPNGVLLDDGTIVRLPPPEAGRLADKLAVGQKLFVRGDGFSGAIGKVVAARELGPDANSLTKLAFRPPPPDERGGPRGPHMRGDMPPPPPGGPMGGPMGGPRP